MKKILTLIIIFALLSSCAHKQDVSECIIDDRYGFFSGLLHGFIAPFTFLVSLFSDDVVVYAINNTGNWYVFGFLLGVGAFTSSANKTSK